MGQYYIAVIAAGAAALLAGGFFGTYQLYKLVQADAESRGLKHPKLWGAFSLAGNGNSGLILYLIGRRKYPVTAMTQERRRQMESRKKRFAVGLVFLAAGAAACVLGMLLSGQF